MYLRIIIFFLFANILGFLEGSIAWDSRLWFTHAKDQNIEALYWFLNQAQLMGQFYLFSAMGFFKDPALVANGLSFLSWMVITLLFYWFINKLNVGTPMARFVAACWIAIKPSMLVAYEPCHMPYNIGILLYFIGLWIFLNYSKRAKANSLYIGLLIIVLFLIWNSSFILLRSLMFLHCGIIFILFLNKNIAYKALILLLCAPLLSWLIRSPPTGVYAAYNQVDLSMVSIRGLLKSFYETNWIIFNRTTKWIWKDIVLIIGFLISCVSIYFALRKIPEQKKVNSKIANVNIFIWLSCCVFFILFLIFPYLVTRPVLDTWDFESRHAILHVFPQALTIVSIGQFFEWKKWYFSARVFFTLLLAMFLMATMENQRRWQIDGFVQDSFIENLKDLSFDRKVSTLIFDTRLGNWLHLQRQIGIYEYNGFLKEALVEERWVGVDKALLNYLNPLVISPLTMKYYLCRNCKATPVVQNVEVQKGSLDPYQWRNYLQLFWTKFFDRKYYQNLSKNLIVMKSGSVQKE